MPQGKEQVQTGARLAPDRLNDQDHDVRIFHLQSSMKNTEFLFTPYREKMYVSNA